SLYDAQHDCPICLSQYEDIDTVTELPCHHLFHLECLEKWVNRAAAHRHPSCPLCRQCLPSTLE
ncbi:anaphase-promoting complex subunit, putative, partial [Perkinsus marinus ATCC 50983]